MFLFFRRAYISKCRRGFVLIFQKGCCFNMPSGMFLFFQKKRFFKVPSGGGSRVVLVFQKCCCFEVHMSQRRQVFFPDVSADQGVLMFARSDILDSRTAVFLFFFEEQHFKLPIGGSVLIFGRRTSNSRSAVFSFFQGAIF